MPSFCNFVPETALAEGRSGLEYRMGDYSLRNELPKWNKGLMTSSKSFRLYDISIG
jgi:hypothetical protein